MLPLKNSVQCKSAVIRLQLRRQKIRNLIKQQRREIAGLLKSGEDENARILVEQIIKDEYKCDAYDELEVYCEELVARLNLISMSKCVAPASYPPTSHSLFGRLNSWHTSRGCIVSLCHHILLWHCQSHVTVSLSHCLTVSLTISHYCTVSLTHTLSHSHTHTLSHITLSQCLAVSLCLTRDFCFTGDQE